MLIKKVLSIVVILWCINFHPAPFYCHTSHSNLIVNQITQEISNIGFSKTWGRKKSIIIIFCFSRSIEFFEDLGGTFTSLGSLGVGRRVKGDEFALCLPENDGEDNTNTVYLKRGDINKEEWVKYISDLKPDILISLMLNQQYLHIK